MSKIDLIGHQFGKLKVRQELGKNYYGHIIWLCDCECGAICTPTTQNLRTGNTKSCGCTHASQYGQSRMKGSLYKTWLGMMARCYKEANQNYSNYGGRGITVCDEWHDYKNFLSDMSPKPNGTSLDRIDNDGNYCKENCRWATPKEQANNRRTNVLYEYGDEIMTLPQWADFANIELGTLKGRVKKGIPFPFAILNIDFRTLKLDYKNNKEES